VALAGAIMPCVAKFSVTLSAQADVFGVGTTLVVGSMLVPASSVIGGWIVPGGALDGISGVESGKAAPLVDGPPGVELHTVFDDVPSGDTGDIVPVVLATIAVGMVPSGVVGIIAVCDVIIVDGSIVAVLLATDVETGLGIDDAGTAGAVMEGRGGAGIGVGGGTGMVDPGTSNRNDVAGCADSVRYGVVALAVTDVTGAAGTTGVVGAAEIDGIVPVVLPTADTEVTGSAGVPGVICPVGVEQITTVPDIVGSEASGTGASVVSGVPGWVIAENGLGPLSGEVTIAPGVDGRPMAVLPIVETCARLASAPSSRAAVVSNRHRIAILSSATI
jgi:hypothetical protein